MSELCAGLPFAVWKFAAGLRVTLGLEAVMTRYPALQAKAAAAAGIDGEKLRLGFVQGRALVVQG